MFRWVFISVFIFTSSPVTAQETEGRDLMAEALRLFMKGLMSELEPSLEDLNDLFQDLNAYHPPEILPNGDIIIRRREPLPLPEEDGEVDL